LVSNVAVYWSESAQSFQYVFTSNTGVTNSNITPTSYANVTVGNVLFVNGAGLYINGTLGAAGSVLGSNGTGVSWVSGGGFNGGTINSSLTINGGDFTASGNVTYGTPTILNGSATVSSIGTGAKLLDSFAISVYRSARYAISVTDVTNTAYQTCDINLLQDGTNANISVYGVLYSGAAAKMTFSSNIISGNVMLWGTGISANNTVKLARTLVPV
jgi:hypothetical protein